MKFILNLIVLVGLSVLITGCKLAVVVVEGGEVESEGSGVCLAESICIIDVTDPSFSEAFSAVPYPGWYFQKWNSGYGFFCGNSTHSTCILNFEGHENSSAVADMLGADEVFYLMPVFKPQKRIVWVGGKEWLQPTLFAGLTWDEINAVCPAGECGDSGTLNGHSMVGWTWASVADAKALLNDYIGYEALDSETHFFKDLTGEAVRKFFNDGWQPTYEGTIRDFFGTEWRVFLRDMESNNSRTYVGEGYVLLLNELEVNPGPNGVEAKRGELVSASFKASVDWDSDYDGPPLGGLFFR